MDFTSMVHCTQFICSTDLLVSSSASEDVPRADEVRALVKDIWDLRVAKLRRSTDIMIAQQESYGKVFAV